MTRTASVQRDAQRAATKGAARAYVGEQLKKGTLTASPVLTFGKYAEQWWRWDTCQYIAGKKARGRAISHGYADIRRGYLEKHILPTFKDIRLSSITPPVIERWLMELRKKETRGGGTLSAATANACLATLKVMLGEAARLGHIARNPAEGIESLKGNAREKSILDVDEVRALFDEKRIAEVWAGDFRHVAMNLLAASTGMRMGEVQGLTVRHVFNDHIVVSQSWERKYGLKEPKWNSARVVPVPSKVSRVLREAIEGSPYREDDDLVFWGRDRKTPVLHIG